MSVVPHTEEAFETLIVSELTTSLLTGAAMESANDREKQGKLLKALLDDDEFRAQAGELVMGSIYDSYRAGAAGSA